MIGRLRLSVLPPLVGIALALPARAQDLAAAEALFREGKALLDGGNFDAACSKLAESERLDASSGTLLNLAVCHEKQGKLATAWAEYLAAARLAETQGKTERVGEAKRRASELEARLPYLTIRMASAVPGVEIRRDDVVLEASSVGSKIPVDPGKHIVTVSAPGYESLSLDVTLGSDADSQTVVIPELKKAEAAPAPKVAPPSAQGAPAGITPHQPPAATSEPPRPATSNTVAWVVGGAGAAIVAAGSAFGVLALSSYKTADQACPTHTGCSSDAMADRHRADTQATIANIGVGVGLVGIGVSAVLLLTSGSTRPKDTQHARIDPGIDSHGGHLSMALAW
jgi:hypothetical protein